MNIKHCLAKFNKKTCIFVVILFCSFSPTNINYACPNVRTTCAMALMFSNFSGTSV